jgi:hypothetical protein
MTSRGSPDGDEASTEAGSVESRSVSGAPFPHREIPEDVAEGRNADRVPRVPVGPQRGPVRPTEPLDDPTTPRTDSDPG